MPAWLGVVLLASTLIAGAALRLYGLNWDAGHWLHPDERQIYFITENLARPHSLSQALTPQSPLNPGFFAYGSLPFYLLKLVTALLSPFWPILRDTSYLHLTGRPLVALFDLGTVYLTYRLVRILYPSVADKNAGLDKEQGIALLAAALVSLAVLHIQLGHFYTVDPILTFFVMLTLTFAAQVSKGGGRLSRIALGIAYGLALATKVSAAPLIVPIIVAYSLAGSQAGRSLVPRLAAILRPLTLTLVMAGIVFVVIQPYALIDWQTFLEHTIRESQIAWGAFDVPYTRQYEGTLPYLYSIWQIALWGLALPNGLLGWTSLGAAIIRWVRHGEQGDSLLLAWAIPYLAITGLLYTRYPRYMLPLVPVLCILIASFSIDLAIKLGKRQRGLLRPMPIMVGSIVLISLLYAVAFLSIYRPPHTWIAASEWVYGEVPPGSTLATEEWDMLLPLPLDVNGQPRRIEEYDVRILPLYDEPDDGAKWRALATDLADSDYVILASRRLYGSIPRLPERYPVTTGYYDALLSGDLGFVLTGEFSRGPTWLNPRIAPLPGSVAPILLPDESLVVYDHPRTLILRNAEHLPPEELLRRLGVQ